MPGIPVVTIPQQGPIATRPRRMGLYDTEGWDDGSAIDAKITIYKDVSRFANADLGLTKQYGRDHNFDGSGGQMPKGQMLHWYSWTMKCRTVAAVKTGAAFQDVWDVIRRIRESTWCTFFFGRTPYLTLPHVCIPQGVGLEMPQGTSTAQTWVSPAVAELDRQNGYDVTLNDLPVAIGPLETFSVEVEAIGVTPTPTVDLYVTSTLRGVFLKGFQG